MNEYSFRKSRSYLKDGAKKKASRDGESNEDFSRVALLRSDGRIFLLFEFTPDFIPPKNLRIQTERSAHLNLYVCDVPPGMFHHNPLE